MAGAALGDSLYSGRLWTPLTPRLLGFGRRWRRGCFAWQWRHLVALCNKPLTPRLLCVAGAALGDSVVVPGCLWTPWLSVVSWRHLDAVDAAALDAVGAAAALRGRRSAWWLSTEPKDGFGRRWPRLLCVAGAALGDPLYSPRTALDADDAAASLRGRRDLVTLLSLQARLWTPLTLRLWTPLTLGCLVWQARHLVCPCRAAWRRWRRGCPAWQARRLVTWWLSGTAAWRRWRHWRCGCLGWLARHLVTVWPISFKLVADGFPTGFRIVSN